MKNQILGLSLLSAVLAMPAATASAQGTLEDYNRAYALRHQFSADSVFHWARSSAWCDSTHVLHYQISTPQGRKFVSYDADKDERKTYDSQEAMEKALGIKPRPAYKPQFGRRHERHWMEVDEEKEAYPVLSPDGKMEAYIEGSTWWFMRQENLIPKPSESSPRMVPSDAITATASNGAQTASTSSYASECR